MWTVEVSYHNFDFIIHDQDQGFHQSYSWSLLMTFRTTYSKLSLFGDDSIIYMPVRSQSDCIKLQAALKCSCKLGAGLVDGLPPAQLHGSLQPVQHNYILHNHTLELFTSAS